MIHPAHYARLNGPYRHGIIADPPDCEHCPLRYDVKVYPDGPVPAKIAFIGEEPGDTELAEGRGFVGPSGQLLWYMANEVGLQREDVWVSNAAMCKARKIKLANNAVIYLPQVKATAAQCCRRRLLSELVVVDPVVIVPLGNWALWATSDIPNARIYAYRGSRIEVEIAELAELVAQGRARSPMRQVKGE